MAQNGVLTSRHSKGEIYEGNTNEENKKQVGHIGSHHLHKELPKCSIDTNHYHMCHIYIMSPCCHAEVASPLYELT